MSSQSSEAGCFSCIRRGRVEDQRVLKGTRAILVAKDLLPESELKDSDDVLFGGGQRFKSKDSDAIMGSSRIEGL